MWLMLTIPSRSTLHSAVSLSFSDITHWPPPAVRSLYNPSTAFLPFQFSLPSQALFSNTDFCSAMFSDKLWAKKFFFKIVKRYYLCFVLKNIHWKTLFLFLTLVEHFLLCKLNGTCIHDNNYQQLCFCIC